MNITLLIMAAGIGSRFGTGIKQLEPVDASNHIIMDYSIHDAIEAGFNHVVFIIRKDIEKEFKEVIGNHISGRVDAPLTVVRPSQNPDLRLSRIRLFAKRIVHIYQLYTLTYIRGLTNG